MLVLLATSALSAPVTDGAMLPLTRAGEAPTERLYARLDELGGPVKGRWIRRREAEFHLFELDDGTVIRAQRYAKDAVVEDRTFDASGRPVTTARFGPDGAVTVEVPPGRVLELAGLTAQAVPGGVLRAPESPSERDGGGARFADLLGGELEIWLGPAVDPTTDTYRDDLLGGCGCRVLDRATTWVDGRPGVRYRLQVPGAWPPDALDLWAVPVAGGTWFATWRATQAADPNAALAPGRAWVALFAFQEAR